VAYELLGGLVAEELHAVAAFDEGYALGRETLQFDGADLRAVLFLLAALLGVLVVVELALNPVGSAMKRARARTLCRRGRSPW